MDENMELLPMSEMVIYKSDDGSVKVDVLFSDETVCRDFRHTTQHGTMEGKTQEKWVKHYNLDVIISVGSKW